MTSTLHPSVAVHGSPGQHPVAGATTLPDLFPSMAPKRGVAGYLRRHRNIAIGGSLVLLILATAVFAPFLFTKDPTALAPSLRLREPSARFWFGTDMLGRDVFSRVLYGGRVSLLIGLAVAFFSSTDSSRRNGHRHHRRCGQTPRRNSPDTAPACAGQR